MSDSNQWRRQQPGQKDLSEAARASEDLICSWERALRATARRIVSPLTGMERQEWEVAAEVIVTVARAAMGKPRRMIQLPSEELLQSIRLHFPEVENVAELYAIRRKLEGLGVIGSKRGKGLAPPPGEKRKRRGPDWLWVDEERIYELVELSREPQTDQTTPNQQKPEKTRTNQSAGAPARASRNSPKGNSEEWASKITPQLSSFLLPSFATDTSALASARSALQPIQSQEEEEEEGFLWMKVKESLEEFGVVAADEANRIARQHGATPQDVRGLLAYAIEHCGAWRSAPGVLYKRITFWRRWQRIDQHWPAASPEWHDPNAAAAKRAAYLREGAAQLREREEFLAQQQAAKESRRKEGDR